MPLRKAARAGWAWAGSAPASGSVLPAVWWGGGGPWLFRCGAVWVGVVLLVLTVWRGEKRLLFVCLVKLGVDISNGECLRPSAHLA